MTSDWKDTIADPLPEQWDAGKQIHLLMDDGSEVVGKLRVADWVLEEGVEIATFIIHTDGTREVPFADSKKWKFAAPAKHP